MPPLVGVKMELRSFINLKTGEHHDHQTQSSTKEAQFARTRFGIKQRQQGLPSYGLFSAAVLRDSPQLPDLWSPGPLWDRLPGPKGPHPNRVSEEVEKAVLEHSLHYPTQGPVRVAQQLVLQNVQVSAGGVRGVWSRHNLLSRHDRLLRLEKTVREQKLDISDTQAGVPRAAHRNQTHRRSRGGGHFLRRRSQGSWSGISPVGHRLPFPVRLGPPLHLQTAGNGSACTQRGRALPFFEQHEARITTILSDNGREFCGRQDRHPYELFLQLEGIEHRTTRVRRPQSNGFVERLHRTLLDEHFRLQGRKKWHETVEQMQVDLDVYLKTYNTERTHQGRNINGRTPYRAFTDELPKNDVEAKTKKAA